MKKNEHTIVVETFKRLFHNKEIDISKVKKLVKDGIITAEECEYIIDRKEE